MPVDHVQRIFAFVLSECVCLSLISKIDQTWDIYLLYAMLELSFASVWHSKTHPTRDVVLSIKLDGTDRTR